MSARSLLGPVAEYYEGKLAEHGATARGVDWNGPESQELRFAKLCELLPLEGSYSVLDFGCGYGELFSFLKNRPGLARYLGFDISPKMIEAAKAKQGADPRVAFAHAESSIVPCDFALASGVLNVRLGTPPDVWLQYIHETLERLNGLGRKGYAFNLLSIYSDADKRRDHLYYADPLKLFDYCKSRHSRFVSLLHDYPLYEFTILVRKE